MCQYVRHPYGNQYIFYCSFCSLLLQSLVVRCHHRKAKDSSRYFIWIKHNSHFWSSVNIYAFSSVILLINFMGNNKNYLEMWNRILRIDMEKLFQRFKYLHVFSSLNGCGCITMTLVKWGGGKKKQYHLIIFMRDVRENKVEEKKDNAE